MSAEAMNWAKSLRCKTWIEAIKAEDREQDPEAEGPQCSAVGVKAVMLALADYADERHSCFPGQELLAEITEQSERTVRRIVQVAERAEALCRGPRYHRGPRGGERTSDRYYLHVPPTKPRMPSECPQCEKSLTGQSDRQGEKGDSVPASSDRLTGQMEQGQRPRVAGEPQEEPQEEPQAAEAAAVVEDSETTEVLNAITEGVSGEAQSFLRSDRAYCAEVVASALNRGWTRDQLVPHLGSPVVNARSPAAAMRSRFKKLPDEPPSAPIEEAPSVPLGDTPVVCSACRGQHPWNEPCPQPRELERDLAGSIF